MKIAATAFLMASLVTTAAAENRNKEAAPHISVCTERVADFRTAAQSHAIASGMFDAIGITIDWRHDFQHCSAQSILITVSDRTPANVHPGAMAYALPYEGAQIRLLYDRIALAQPRLRPVLLAHVLVHEIAHILQGLDRHSDEGVMKAHWTQDDYSSMLRRPLEFSGEDIDLIYRGVAARNLRSLASH